MSYFITGTRILTAKFNTIGTAPFDVTPPNNDRPVCVASVLVTERSGGTPNVTIDVLDTKSATVFTRKYTAAVPALSRVEDLEPLYLQQTERLRVTVSAGSCSVFVNYFDPNAAGTRA